MSVGAKGLANLPDELLHAIFLDLDKSSFNSLCRVSRRLYGKSLPWLYSIVHLDLHNSKEVCTQLHESALLLRTLLQSSRLASYINHFAIAVEDARLRLVPLPEDLDDRWLTVWTARTSRQQQEDFIEKTSKALGLLDKHQSIRTAQQTNWLNLLNWGRIELVIAGIFLVSTNLRSLQLGSRVWQSRLLDELLKPILSLQLHHSLYSVDLCPDIQSEDDIYLHEGTYGCLIPILQLPNLTRFSAPLPALHNIELIPAITTRPMALQTLSLKRTELSEEMLGIILQSTPLLRSLTYWSCYCVENRRPGRMRLGEYLDCDKLGRSLLHVKNTLVELSLAFVYFEYGCDWRGLGPGCAGSLSILNQFSRLTTLMVPHLVILGWSKEGSSPKLLSNVLPSSIRNFTLTDDLYDMNESDWSALDIVEQLKQLEERISVERNGQEDLELAMHIRFPTYRRSDRNRSFTSLCAEYCVRCEVLESEADGTGCDALPMIIRRRSTEDQRIRGLNSRRHHGILRRGRARGGVHRGGRGIPRGGHRGRGMHE